VIAFFWDVTLLPWLAVFGVSEECAAFIFKVSRYYS